MNEQTPTRDDLSDSRGDTSPKTNFSREPSNSNVKRSGTKRVESSYFSPKTNREPSAQFAQSPSENNFQQFTLNSNNRLESKESEKDKQEQMQEEKPQSKRSKPNSKYKEHKQKAAQKNKEHNQGGLINIKVSTSKGKGTKKHYKSTVENETDRSLQAEIWTEGNTHREILSTQSVFDSDVADEIDYEFDPEYICRLNQRYLSPNLDKKHPRDHSQYSGSPTRSRRGQKSELQYNLNIDGNQNTGDILHQACKQISSVKCGKKKQKNFIKRMQHDVDKRVSRERTIGTLQDNLIRSKASPGKNDDTAQGVQVSQLSPHSQSKYSNSPQHETPQKFDINSENLGLTVSSKKKLGKKQCLEMYERQKQFEDRKYQAIQMMQQAQLKKEQAEIASKQIGKGKISDSQKQNCCDRLNNDADRRKDKLKKKKEQELMKLEQECQEYFKPKINTKYKIKREHVMSAENLLSGSKEYKNKLDRFQHEAQQRGQNKGMIQMTQDVNSMGQNQQNGPNQEIHQVA